jgi:hypothetical protein
VLSSVGFFAVIPTNVFRVGGGESSSRNRTTAAHGAIRTAPERYKEKFGDYPTPTNPDETGSFDGKTLRTGGAHMLYQAMTGDGNCAFIIVPAPPAGVRESDGRLDQTEEDRVLGASTLPKGVVFPPHVPADTMRPRFIVDGWGRPFQYIKADPHPAKNKAINPTCDLWSYGPKVGSVSPPDSVEARRDEKATGSWLVNWR